MICVYEVCVVADSYCQRLVLWLNLRLSNRLYWFVMRVCIFAIAVFVFSLPLYAVAGVTTIQAMSMGEFVSKNNDTAYDVTIRPNGTYSFDAAGYIEIVAPVEGIYDITGLAPSSAIASVTVTQSAPLTIGGRSFQMVNFQETHDAVTSAGGVAQVIIGTTARSDGTGVPYPDRAYAGTINITINF